MKTIKIFLPKQYYENRYLLKSFDSIDLYGWCTKLDENQVSVCVVPNLTNSKSQQIKQKYDGQKSGQIKVVGLLAKRKYIENENIVISITINSGVIILNGTLLPKNLSQSPKVLMFVYDDVDFLSVLPLAIPPCACDTINAKNDSEIPNELDRGPSKWKRFSSFSKNSFLWLINPIIDKTAVASHFSFWWKFMGKSNTR